MKKLGIFKTRLLSIGMISAMGVLLSTPIFAQEPPPPPPPPEEETVSAINRFLKVAQKVETAHTNFMTALQAYLQDPKNVQKSAELNNAASVLADSIGAVKRMMNRMEKDVSGYLKKDPKREVTLMQDQVNKSTLPKRDKEDLMNELKKRLEKRRPAAE